MRTKLMISKGQIMIKKAILILFLVLFSGNLNAETKTLSLDVIKKKLLNKRNLN